MARPITTTAVGRVNRRFLFLALVLAVLSAVLVYAAVTRSGGGSSSAVDTPVLVATQDIAAGTEITGGMVEVTSFPDTQVPAGAIEEASVAVGLIAKENIAAREAVLTSSLVDVSQPIDENVLSYIIEAQQRGMAITAAQVVTGGGLVLPGDHVDVYWIPNDPREDTPAALLAENIEVLAVQQTVLDIGPTAPGVTEDPEGAPPAEGDDRNRSNVEAPVPEAVTVTLMLSPRQALNVFCGNKAGELRLAVRAWGDESPSGAGITPVECQIQGAEEIQ
jgi:Flp pilus assembly protein CpaB